jgi:hypothetical protein
MSATSSSPAVAEGPRTGQPAPGAERGQEPGTRSAQEHDLIPGGMSWMGSARLLEERPAHRASRDANVA